MPKKKENKINIRSKKDEKKSPERASTPSVWTPFDLMDTMDRWFWEDPWTPFWQKRRYGNLTPMERISNRWLDPSTKISAIDMIDTGKEFKILAEMPGIDKKDININITDKNISICGETQTETKKDEEGWIRRERSYSTICRTMLFPEEVNPDRADATLRDGILEITVTKKRPTSGKGRNIPVK